METQSGPPLPDGRPDPGATRSRRVVYTKRRGSRRSGGKFQRIFRRDRAFAAAVVLFALLLIALAALLPKIYRASPPWAPVVRISGMDWLQARSLRRSAMRAQARGAAREALQSWNAAIASNPADTEALRGALEAVLAQPDIGPGRGGSAAELAGWLLTMGGTNRSDVNLAVRVFSQVEQDDHATAFAERLADSLDAPAYAALASAEFRLGRTDRYAALWTARAAELATDPAAALYHAAWLAGWGPPSTLIAGRRALDAAAEGADLGLATLARRLMLRVAAVSLDIDAYRRHLAWLEERRLDRVTEQVRLWALLVAAGRQAEAAAKAREFVRPPETARDLILLADVLSQLGLDDEAARLLERERKRFGESAAVWRTLARLKIKGKKWSDLRELAGALRAAGGPARAQLEGYSRFLAGLADYGLGRLDSAEQEFKAAAANRGWEPGAAFECAAAIRASGYPAIAGDLLRQVQERFKDKAEFWFELALEAYGAGETEAFAQAAAKAYELAPKRAGVINNYAAALLLTRENPQKALELTSQIPITGGGAPATINRAMALLQNGRLEEAAGLLRTLDPQRLPPAETAAAHFAWAEYHVHRRDAPAARAEYGRANPNFLLAPQKRWFNEQIQKLDPVPPQQSP